MVGHIKIQTTDKRYNCYKYQMKDRKIMFNERSVALNNVVSIIDTNADTVLYQHPTRQIKPKVRTKVFHVGNLKFKNRDAVPTRAGADSSLPTEDESAMIVKVKRAKKILDVIEI